jgi:hypothetical protein
MSNLQNRVNGLDTVAPASRDLEGARRLVRQWKHWNAVEYSARERHWPSWTGALRQWPAPRPASNVTMAASAWQAGGGILPWVPPPQSADTSARNLLA